MTETSAQLSSSPAARRPPTARPRPAALATPGRTRGVEILAPDAECAGLLLEYTSPSFPTELVAGSGLIVRIQPPAGAGWVLDLLSLIERWLGSARLPCATVLYGGRSYLIRSSTHLAQAAVAAPPTELRH